MRAITCMVGLFVAVTISPAADACDCSKVYADLIEKLEANYLGLRQNRDAGKLVNYEDHKSTFADRAAGVDAAGCTEILHDFLKFQDDGHVFVFERPEYTADEIGVFKKFVRENALDMTQLNDLLERASDGIVGKWGDGTSEIAIVAVEGQFHAYLLTSTAEDTATGQLKAVLSATEDGYAGTYYSYGHAPRYVAAGLYRDDTLLSFGGKTIWEKLGAIDAADPIQPTVKQLDEDSILLSLPSFLIDFDAFKGFLAKHRKLLVDSKHLVIDIRGNTGGNAVYFPLLELFATRNKPGSRGLVLASEDTLAYFKARSKGSRISAQVVKNIENGMGEIVDGPVYPSKKMKPAKTKIETVAILTDRGCMSAAESFVLHARQVSDKVKTFGSPTAGVIDFTSVNLLALPSGARNIYFGYPTSTLHEKIPEGGYNQTGILPDVPIDDAVVGKLEFVLDAIR